MTKRHYTHEDLERELLRTPKARKAYEDEVMKLMVAHQIAELREKNHMSQKELAKRLHTKQQVVSRLEQDRYRPSLTTLEKVAGVFGKRLEIRFV